MATKKIKTDWDGPVNKFNIGDELYIPVRVTGVKLFNDRIYYSLQSNTSNVTFKMFDPDQEVYPKTLYDQGNMVRSATIVEDDLIKISGRP